MKFDYDLRLTTIQQEVSSVHALVKDRMKAQVTQLVTETMQNLNFRVDQKLQRVDYLQNTFNQFSSGIDSHLRASRGNQEELKKQVEMVAERLSVKRVMR